MCHWIVIFATDIICELYLIEEEKKESFPPKKGLTSSKAKDRSFRTYHKLCTGLDVFLQDFQGSCPARRGTGRQNNWRGKPVNFR